MIKKALYHLFPNLLLIWTGTFSIQKSNVFYQQFVFYLRFLCFKMTAVCHKLKFHIILFSSYSKSLTICNDWRSVDKPSLCFSIMKYKTSLKEPRLSILLFECLKYKFKGRHKKFMKLFSFSLVNLRKLGVSEKTWFAWEQISYKLYS